MPTKFHWAMPIKGILFVLLLLGSLMLVGGTAWAQPNAPSNSIVFQITGHVSNDPFSLGLAGEPFEAEVTFDPANLNEEGNKIFPVRWVFHIGKYRVSTRQGAINLDNDVPCDIPPLYIFDGWQVVDEQNPVRGRIAGNRVTYLAINFQDHTATALDNYDITQPLNLDNWELGSGTISLAGLEGEIVVEVETFTRLNSPN